MRQWILLWAMMAIGQAQAHVGNHPSVHDTVAGILDRFVRTKTTNELKAMQVPAVLALITPAERAVLGAEHVLF